MKKENTNNDLRANDLSNTGMIMLSGIEELRIIKLKEVVDLISPSAYILLTKYVEDEEVDIMLIQRDELLSFGSHLYDRIVCSISYSEKYSCIRITLYN